MHHLEATYMTEEEQRLPSFTYKCLQKLSNWNDWDICHDNQINGHVLTDSSEYGGDQAPQTSYLVDKNKQTSNRFSRGC